MAGSYRHVTRRDGSFRGLDLIENLGDAYEAIEEMHDMIEYLARMVQPDEPLVAIHQAWREGHLRPRVPGNAANERIAGFGAYWTD